MSLSLTAIPTVRYRASVSQGAQRLTFALIIFAIILFLSIAIAQILKFTHDYGALSGWGGWTGIFISSLALIGTTYAVISQIGQSETTSWSIALSRLGTLYDLALKNSDFAQMLAEPSVPLGDPQPLYPTHTLTAEQRVWLGSLFLAYEQIFVATLSLSSESRRVWQKYIGNQLNKPSIRAEFCRDGTLMQDYHCSFWQFAHTAIDERFFNAYIGQAAQEAPAAALSLKAAALIARPMHENELGFWRTLYSDPEVKRQMYAAPLGSDVEFKAFLRKRTLFTVYKGEEPIGGFSITREGETMGTFGFLISQAHRRKGYGNPIIRMLEQQARRMGIHTLRADVYEDNVPSIKALENQQFRRFIWVEKNI
jgi:RimJ/RimL family protein N-acetyltransferase